MTGTGQKDKTVNFPNAQQDKSGGICGGFLLFCETFGHRIILHALTPPETFTLPPFAFFMLHASHS
jgi:hypothetical protein